MADLQCYLQVKVSARKLGNGTWKVDTAKVINMTQAYPTQLVEGATHVVECRLAIPDGLLLPIEAEAMVPELRLKAEYDAIVKELEQ